MPHHNIPGHTDPQGPTVEQKDIFSTIYNKGLDVDAAVNRYSILYGVDDEQSINYLRSFYEEEDKKKSQNGGASGSSSEEDSGGSTSTTSQVQEEDDGASVGVVPLSSQLSNIAYGSPEPPQVFPGYIPTTDSTHFSGKGEWLKFGPSSDPTRFPQSYNINPSTLLSQGVDNDLMNEMELMETDLFERWFTQKLSNEDVNKGFSRYLSGNSEFAQVFWQAKEQHIPLIAFQDKIVEVLAAIEAYVTPETKIQGDEISQEELEKKRRGLELELQQPGLQDQILSIREPDEIKRDDVIRIENEWNTFLRDAVLTALPTTVQGNEQKLKALEYHFKLGRNYMFDFNEDKIVGDKTTWPSEWDEKGDIFRALDRGGLTALGVLAWHGNNVMATGLDLAASLTGQNEGPGPDGTFYSEHSHDIHGNPQRPVEGRPGRYHPTHSGQYTSIGDKRRSDGAIERDDVVGKRVEELGIEMNSYVDDIGTDFNTWWQSGFTDSAALDRVISRQFTMAAEATPQILAITATAWLTKNPKAVAFVSSTLGTAYDAERISMDTNFDDWIDKEDGEVLSKNEAISVLVDKQVILPGDSEAEIELKLADYYDVETNNMARGWFLGSTWGTSYAVDRTIFGIFARAAGANPAAATTKEYLRNLFLGAGLSIPQASGTQFIDMFNRNIQETLATGKYDDFSYNDAAWSAWNQTLTMMPLAPMMTFAGAGWGYTRNLAADHFGYNGRTINQRKVISELEAKARNNSISPRDRLGYYRLLHEKQRQLIDGQHEAKKFYDWMGRQGDDGLAALSDLTYMSNRMDYLYRQLEKLKPIQKVDAFGKKMFDSEGKPMMIEGGDPNVRMMFKEELATLMDKRLEIENQFRGRYDQYVAAEPTTLRKEGTYVDAEGNTSSYLVEVDIKTAKKSLTNQGIKKPSKLEIVAEQRRLVEIGMRETQGWVMNNIKEKPATSLTRAELDMILASEKHAILTGENPNGKGQGEGFNANANKAARAWLKSQGLVFHEVTGKYGGGENSFLVENISIGQAKAFARIFGQHSVAYGNKGLIKSDGSILPFKKKANMNVDYTKAGADFYTAIKLSDGSVVSFSRNTKVAGTDANGKPIRSEGFFDTGSKNHIIDAAQNVISDATAIKSLESGKSKGKNEDGTYSKEQIRDKKIQLFNDFTNRARPGQDLDIDPNITPGTKQYAKLMAEAEVHFSGRDPVARIDADEINTNGDGGDRGNIVPNDGTQVQPQSPISTNWFSRFMRNWLSDPMKNLANWRSRGARLWKRVEDDAVLTSETMRQQMRDLKAESLVLQGDIAVLNAVLETARFRPDGTKLPKAEYNARVKEINRYLQGDKDAYINFMDGEQIAVVNAMRSRIDGFTQRIIDLLAQNPTEGNLRLIETLAANKGEYMKRSYEAFTDDGNWLREINKPLSKMKGKYRTLYDNAVEFVMKEQGVEVAEGQRIVSDYINDIVTRIDNKTYRAGSGALGALDTKMFVGRKDIPEPFRRLLGQIDDPYVNYINTTHRLASYITDLTYQNTLRSNLIDAGWARTEKNKIQGDVLLTQGQAWKGLEGLYVDQGFKQVYEDMAPVGASKYTGLRYLFGLQGTVKIGMTIYSPATAARNLYGGNLLGMANGHFFATNPGKFLDTVRLAWGIDPKQRVKGSRLAAEEKTLTRLGIVGDSARAGEIAALINEWSTKSQLVREAERYGGAGSAKELKRAVSDLDNTVQKIYAFGDDFYKVAGYYTERQRFIDSGMDAETASTRAAERVRGGYPTYSYVGRNVQHIRRNPIAGMFVAFPHEVIRTQVNQLKFIAEDLYEGRPKMAMQRALGFLGAYGALNATYETSKYLLGLTDEDLEAFKLLSPEYHENILPTFLHVDQEDGSILFIDNAGIVPQEYIMKPLRSLMGDGSVDDKTAADRIMSAVQELTAPYTGLDATTKSLFELIMNGKDGGTGEKIYYQGPEDSFFDAITDEDNATSVFNHLRTTIGPGGARNIAEIFQANDIMPEIFGGKKNKWKEYNNTEAILAFLGFRVQTLKPGQAVATGIYDTREVFNNFSSWHTSTDQLSRMHLMETQDIRDLGVEIAEMMVLSSNDCQRLVNACMHLPDYSPEDYPGKRQDDYRIMLKKSNIPDDEVDHYFANYANNSNVPWIGFFDKDANFITKGKLETIKKRFDESYTGPEDLRGNEWDKLVNSIVILNDYIRNHFMKLQNIELEKLQELVNNDE